MNKIMMKLMRTILIWLNANIVIKNLHKSSCKSTLRIAQRKNKNRIKGKLKRNDCFDFNKLINYICLQI